MSKSRGGATKLSSFPYSMFKAIFLTVLFCAVTVLLMAMIASLLPDPAAYVKPLAYTALGISLFLGGIAAAKLTKGSFLSGVLAGGVISLLCFLLGRILGIAPAFPMPLLLFFYLGIPLLSGIGGILGAKNRKPKRRRIR